MKIVNLLLGPKDVKSMFDKVAAAKKNIHKFQVQVEIDESRAEIVTVTYFPIGADLRPITDVNGVVIQGQGCPYPPDCDTLFQKLINGEVSGKEFADCVQRVNDVSKHLN